MKTQSPMFYCHWRLKAGVQAELPAEYPERAAYVAQGVVEVDGREFHAGQMLVFKPGQPVLSPRSPTPSSCCWAIEPACRAG